MSAEETEKRQERKLAAIMFTDIVGYTALMAKDESKAFRVLQKNRSVQKPTIKKHRGEFLKELGDGTLSSFQSAVDAVNCALEMQRLLKDETEFKIRIGVHVGDVVVDGGDIFGDGVNVASRIEPLAPAGGISISGQVHDTIINRPDIESVFLGAKSLKNVGRDIEVYALCGEGLPKPSEEVIKAAKIDKSGKAVGAKKRSPIIPVAVIATLVLAVGIGIFFFMGGEKPPKEPPAAILPFQTNSIAVLPFADLSPLEDQEYFAEGTTDAVTTKLSKLEGLKVISNTAVARYKRTDKDVREIGKELGVSTILRGSIQKETNNIVVAVQLVNVADGSNIWSETYKQEPENIFTIQDEILKAVAGIMNIKLTSDTLEELKTPQPENFQAYDSYLAGMHLKNTFVESGEEGDFKSALKKFQAAIASAPGYSPAYAGLGAVYEAHYDTRQGSERDADLMLKNYKKAVSLDPNLAEANAALGQVYFKQGELDKAYDSLKKAISTSPNVSSINSIVGNFFKEIGLYHQAIKYYARALERDPFDSWSQVQRPLCFMLAGEFEKSEGYIERALEIEPGNFILNYMYVKLLLEMKEYGRAEDLMAKMENDWPDSTSYFRGLLYAFRGEQEAAFSFGKTGEIYSLLGMKDEAIEYINNSINAGKEGTEDHFFLIFYDYLCLTNTPFYDDLREDERFNAIVEQQKGMYEKRLKKYGDL